MSRSLSSIATRQKPKAFRRSAKIVPDSRGTSPGMTTTGTLTQGAPEPLGVTADAAGVNVAVFSAHATKIEFCLFDDTGTHEVARFALPGRSGDIWHGHIAGIEAGARYGLRAHGPHDPQAGHRFDAEKLLLDPY